MAAKARKTETGLTPERAIARALAADLEAGVKAVGSAAKGAAAELPEPSLAALVGGLLGQSRARAQEAGELQAQAHAAALAGEAERLASRVAALESDGSLPPPADAKGLRVLDGTILDGADRSPLPLVGVVACPEGGDRAAWLAAAVTDDRGRFQLAIESGSAAGAQIEVLGADGRTVSSCPIPPDDEAGDHLYIEVDAASVLPQSRLLGQFAGERRASALASAKARLAAVRAELALLGGGV